MKKILFALIVILLSVSGCTSYERCIRKYGQSVTDTAQVYVEYIVPKDSVITHVVIDSIQYMIPGEVKEVKSNRATIKYWKDKHSNLLMMQADCDTIYIRDTIKLTYTKQIFTPPAEKKKKNRWIYALVVVFGIITILMIINKIIKK